MIQIDISNVMEAYRLFDRQAASMQRTIQRSSSLRDIPACGEDVISVDARALFQTKIDEILDAHIAHLDELREARDRLREAAEQYGLVDEQTATGFSAMPQPNSHGFTAER